MHTVLSPEIEATASPAGHPRLNASMQSGKSHDWQIKSTGFDPSNLTADTGDTINFKPWLSGSLMVGGTMISSPYTVTGNVTVTFSPTSGSGDKTGTITVGVTTLP